MLWAVSAKGKRPPRMRNGLLEKSFTRLLSSSSAAVGANLGSRVSRGSNRLNNWLRLYWSNHGSSVSSWNFFSTFATGARYEHASGRNH